MKKKSSILERARTVLKLLVRWERLPPDSSSITSVMK